MITEQALIENGYKKYKPDILHEGCLCFFQKDIKNFQGIKYFINIYEYSYKDIPNHPFPDRINWQAEVQFQLTDNQVCNIEFFGDLKDIIEIENFFSDIWHRMGIFEYYEFF